MSAAPGPLAGRTIAVTRPQAQSAALGEAITRLGGTPLYFPLLEILPADNPQALQTAAARLVEHDLAIFISPNAVAHALPALLAIGPWPSALRVAAVGPGTAAALADAGVAGCLVPATQFDSEALLALPELQAVAGKKVLIFRGDSGRELLAETLRHRGAQVECVTCYRRRPPAAGFAVLLSAWQEGRLDGLTLSSSEGLRYLLAGLDDAGLAYLRQTPVFVPHARIAEAARSSGLQQVVLTKPADAGILAGLCAYNWSQS